MILLCLNPNTYLSLLFLISYCQPSSLPLPSTRTVQRWHHLHARCATPPTRKAALFVIQPRIAPRPAKGPTGRSTKSSANLPPHSLDAHHHHTNWHFFSPRPQKPQKLSGWTASCVQRMKVTAPSNEKCLIPMEFWAAKKSSLNSKGAYRSANRSNETYCEGSISTIRWKQLVGRRFW